MRRLWFGTVGELREMGSIEAGLRWPRGRQFLYVFYVDGEPIYVGKSVALAQRFGDHLDPNEGWGSRPSNVRPYLTAFSEHADGWGVEVLEVVRGSHDTAEMELIWKHRPCLNRRGLTNATRKPLLGLFCRYNDAVWEIQKAEWAGLRDGTLTPEMCSYGGPPVAALSDDWMTEATG